MPANSNNDDQIIDTSRVTTGALTRVLDKLIDGAERSIRKKLAARKQKNKTDLQKLLRRQAEHCAKVKNILYQDESVAIKDLYVPLTFSRIAELSPSKGTAQTITEVQLTDQLIDPKRIIVTGTAGAGKSFFIRWTLLRLSQMTTAPLPLFFELRNLNNKPAADLEKALFSNIQLHADSLMPEQLELGLGNGSFALLLDGFDEIEPNLSNHYQDEILRLSKKYPKSAILLTSRPIDSLLAWQDFCVFQIDPLDKESSIRLVEKLKFDQSVKTKFIAEVERRLYKQHRDFLSVPLLITMMLVTFNDAAEISSSLATFYNDAFSALFFRHDARKEAFNRKLYSGLTREQFRNFFSAFCLLSYSDHKYQFSKSEILKLSEKAISTSGFTADAELLFRDLSVSSCMLIKDGRRYIFAHRSFQEYFTAIFVGSCHPALANKLLKKIADRVLHDQVAKLLLEINPELLETKWVLPRLERILRKLERDNPSDPKRALLFSFFSVSARDEVDLDQNTSGAKVVLGFRSQLGHDFFALTSLYELPIYLIMLNLERLIRPGRDFSGSRNFRNQDLKNILLKRRFPREVSADLKGIYDRLKTERDRIKNSYKEQRLHLEDIVLGTSKT